MDAYEVYRMWFPEATEEEFEEAYEGQWDSPKDWAMNLLEDMGYNISDWPYNYFDYEAFIRDCECSGDYIFDEENGYVFRRY